MSAQALQSLASGKALGSPAMQIAWQRAAQALQQADLPAPQSQQLLEASGHPDELPTLIHHWREQSAEFFASLIQESTHTDAPLSELLAAAAHCARWAELHNRHEPPARILGYIRCCEEARQMMHAPEKLSQLTLKYLQQYGIAEE